MGVLQGLPESQALLVEILGLVVVPLLAGDGAQALEHDRARGHLVRVATKREHAIKSCDGQVVLALQEGDFAGPEQRFGQVGFGER